MLLNNFVSKESVKEIWPVYVILQEKKINEKIYKKCGSRSFGVCKELSTTSTRKWNFCSKLHMLDM